jgi:hypothetical protein
MSASAHKLTVKYSPEPADAEPVLDKWIVWVDDAGKVDVVYAKGPCPSCGVVVQGWTAHTFDPIPSGPPVKGLDEEGEKITTVIEFEIPVRCNCGYPHGEEKATGCGRYWGIQGLRTVEEAP